MTQPYPFAPQPAAPQQPGFPAQPYPFAPQQPQQFVPQPAVPVQQPFGYPAPAPAYGYPPVPQQPARPLPQGTLADFYAQPSGGGGPAISWKDAPVGTVVVGTVARDVTSADVRADTDPSGNPKFYRDGRPRFLMVVPLKVPASQAHPEGEAGLFVRGQLRDELQRAMSAAGVEGAPKAGDMLQVAFTGTRASRQPGAQPARQFAVVYHREGVHAPAQAQPAAPSPQPVPPVMQPVAQVPVPALPQPVAQVPAVAPAGQPSALDGMSAEQQALFARLAGGQG